jgi:thioredoxin reductase
MIHDVIIVGGSYAGLAAGLQIARARRRLAIVDAGQRRNRFAATSHGFLGQDGRAPGTIADEARRQLLAYPTVELIEATVSDAVAGPDGFAVTGPDGLSLQGRRLVLATGVIDTLPAIAGLEERWGRSVFHCPYCHGYEIDRGRIGVVATGPISMHQAQLVAEWGQTTLLTNGAFMPDAEQLADLARRGIAVEASGIERIDGGADVVLDDGRTLEFDGLFTAPRTSMASPVAEQLGCRFVEGPMGAYIDINPMMETSVAGVFACGDAARAAGSVSLAVGDGCMAGVSAHRSLVFPD